MGKGFLTLQIPQPMQMYVPWMIARRTQRTRLSERGFPQVSDNTGWDRIITISLSTGEVDEVSPIKMEEADVIKACEILDIDRNTNEAINFIRSLEGAIAIFKAHRKKDRPETIAEIKAALARLKRAELKAKHLFEDLSPAEQYQLNFMLPFSNKTSNEPFKDPDTGVKTPSTCPATFNSLAKSMILLRNRLIDAIDLFIENMSSGSGGAPMNIPERLLIIALAEAYEDATGEKPTTTVESPFERLLRLALRIGGDEKADDKSLFSLIRRTLEDSKPHSKS
jgi:hypothetical protein